MEDQVKKEVETPIEVKVETKPEVKVETENKPVDVLIKGVETINTDISDIFISENDTFDILIKFYKKDGKLIVEDTDADFNASEKCKEITVTIKHPDQSDCYTIASSSPKFGSDIEKMDIRDFMRIELTRFIVLARKWSVDKPLNSENIMNLNPKIIKGLVSKIREKIGMDGIF